MRVLLTGGAGFIGSHVADRLAGRGDAITIVDNFDPFYAPATKRRNLSGVLALGQAEVVQADILADDLAGRLGKAGFDAIIHLAARAGVRPSLERPLDYARTNVEGTLAMLELARSLGVRRFIFGSSSSVYGDTTPVPFLESAPALDPISPYAATKRAGEILCSSHAHLYGLSVAGLRLFTVYGPRQRPDLAIHRFARLMTRGKPIPFFGDGSTERDYTFVDDIVAGIVAALDWTGAQPSSTFELFNLGESETTSLSALVDLIATELGVTPVLDRQPLQPGDVQRTFADVSKARAAFGYSPSTTMRAGIRKFVEWFRREHPD